MSYNNFDYENRPGRDDYQLEEKRRELVRQDQLLKSQEWVLLDGAQGETKERIEAALATERNERAKDIEQARRAVDWPKKDPSYRGEYNPQDK